MDAASTTVSDPIRRPADASDGSPPLAPVALIIVNWNGKQHLERCLPAVMALRPRPAEILVADNGSRDGSQEWLRAQWPQVGLLELGENLGFAEANNRAIRETRAPWLALLNNDTRPEPGWLAALLAATEGRPRLGSVASCMLFMDESDRIQSAGIALDPSGIAWDRLGGAAAEEGRREAVVFGASAGAALYRREALDDVAEPDASGAPACFDPDFFMYLEDVDLAWRLRLRGWDSAYAPDARVLHHGSASSGEGSPFKNRLLARNKVWTLIKCYPGGPLLLRLPVVLAYDLGSAPYRLLFQGQTAALSGRIRALGALGPCLAKRRRIQGRRSAAWREIRAAMSPLESPLAVLRRYAHLRPAEAGTGAGAGTGTAGREEDRAGETGRLDPGPGKRGSDGS